jgi:hypothetical protein
MKLAPTLPKDQIIVMNMCGRGDKDIFTVAKHLVVTMKVSGDAPDESDKKPAARAAGLFCSAGSASLVRFDPKRAFRHKLSFIGTTLVHMNPGLNP